MTASSPFALLKQLHERALSDAAKDTDNQRIAFQGVPFVLGQLRCAVAVDNLVGVYPLPKITPLPRVKPWCLGLANVNGRVVSVVHLRRFLQTLVPASEQAGSLSRALSVVSESTDEQAGDAESLGSLLVCRTSSDTSVASSNRVAFAVGRVDTRKSFSQKTDAGTDLLPPSLQPFFKGCWSNHYLIDCDGVASSDAFVDAAL